MTTTLSVSTLADCGGDPGGDRCATAQFEQVPGRTVVYGIDRTGGQRTPLGDEIPSLGSTYLGLAEEGHELVIGETNVRTTWSYGLQPSGDFGLGPASQENVTCQIGYRSVATLAVTGPVVAAEYVCQAAPGSGTIAPAPPVALTRR